MWTSIVSIISEQLYLFATAEQHLVQLSLVPSFLQNLLMKMNIIMFLLLGSTSKHRLVSLTLFRRTRRSANTPAPVDCRLSQWSEWTNCFPCQEKKVRLHCNVFIYLQMCLWWGYTHINYIYYTYSSFLKHPVNLSKYDKHSPVLETWGPSPPLSRTLTSIKSNFSGADLTYKI